MLRTQRRSSSVYAAYTNVPKNVDALEQKLQLTHKQRNIGISIGICLSIIAFALQCTAFITPHWKEISPNTHSLYVEGVDALIRTEVLIYFNTIHRFTRHSYGLFHRCEYLLNDSIKLVNKREKTCTKNAVPFYKDEHFDECHSLQYYQFCSQRSGKIFDINNDYLRVLFDVSSNSHINTHPKHSCDCHYPTYVKACHILGIFALIFLFLTSLLYGIFPCLKNRDHRLKVKCFAVLISILSILFILTNLLVVLHHLQYESIEYLIDIERHYRSAQIYKLSQDTKVAIDRFISSINIEIGYSTIIAWIAFVLSVVDAIFIMITCKVTQETYDIASLFSGVPINPSEEIASIEIPEYQRTPVSATTDSQLPPFAPKIVIDDFEEEEESKTQTQSPPSCLKRSPTTRVNFDDEV